MGLAQGGFIGSTTCPAALLCVSGLLPIGRTEQVGLLSRDLPSQPAGASRLLPARQPASQPSLRTWSSLSGRRWARAPRGPSPPPCAEPTRPAEAWGPAASAPARPQLRARSLQRLVRLAHSGSRPAHLPAARRPPPPPRPGRTPGPRRGGGWGGRRDWRSWRQTQPRRAQLRLETDGGGRRNTPPLRRREAGHLPRRLQHRLPPPPSSRRLRAGPGGTGRRLRLALPAPRAAAAGRGSPASRGGAAAARQAASLWESERGAGSAGEARG